MDNIEFDFPCYSVRYFLSVVAFFLLGSAASCWMVYRSDSNVFSWSNIAFLYENRGYGFTLLSICWLPLLLICTGPSIQGRFIRLSLATIRGFMLTSMTCLIQIGIGWEWNVIGYCFLPALFSTIAFFIISLNCENRSGTLQKLAYISHLGILVSVILLLLAAGIRQLMISL